MNDDNDDGGIIMSGVCITPFALSLAYFMRYYKCLRQNISEKQNRESVLNIISGTLPAFVLNVFFMYKFISTALFYSHFNFSLRAFRVACAIFILTFKLYKFSLRVDI